MLGKSSDHHGLYEGAALTLDCVGADSFYDFLASQRGHFVRDEDLAELYCHANGRPSVPPSILATAVILQTYQGVSDAEARSSAFLRHRMKLHAVVDTMAILGCGAVTDTYNLLDDGITSLVRLYLRKKCKREKWGGTRAKRSFQPRVRGLSPHRPGHERKAQSLLGNSILESDGVIYDQMIDRRRRGARGTFETVGRSLLDEGQ